MLYTWICKLQIILTSADCSYEVVFSVKNTSFLKFRVCWKVKDAFHYLGYDTWICDVTVIKSNHSSLQNLPLNTTWKKFSPNYNWITQLRRICSDKNGNSRPLLFMFSISSNLQPIFYSKKLIHIPLVL